MIAQLKLLLAECRVSSRRSGDMGEFWKFKLRCCTGVQPALLQFPPPQKPFEPTMPSPNLSPPLSQHPHRLVAHSSSHPPPNSPPSLFYSPHHPHPGPTLRPATKSMQPAVPLVNSPPPPTHTLTSLTLPPPTMPFPKLFLPQSMPLPASPWPRSTQQPGSEPCQSWAANATQSAHTCKEHTRQRAFV
jgi:hypothetical protein